MPIGSLLPPVKLRLSPAPTRGRVSVVLSPLSADPAPARGGCSGLCSLALAKFLSSASFSSCSFLAALFLNSAFRSSGTTMFNFSSCCRLVNLNVFFPSAVASQLYPFSSTR